MLLFSDISNVIISMIVVLVVLLIASMIILIVLGFVLKFFHKKRISRGKKLLQCILMVYLCPLVKPYIDGTIASPTSKQQHVDGIIEKGNNVKLISYRKK